MSESSEGFVTVDRIGVKKPENKAERMTPEDRSKFPLKAWLLEDLDETGLIGEEKKSAVISRDIFGELGISDEVLCRDVTSKHQAVFDTIRTSLENYLKFYAANQGYDLAAARKAEARKAMQIIETEFDTTL